jgi:hypothetical protein
MNWERYNRGFNDEVECYPRPKEWNKQKEINRFKKWKHANYLNYIWNPYIKGATDAIEYLLSKL